MVHLRRAFIGLALVVASGCSGSSKPAATATTTTIAASANTTTSNLATGTGPSTTIAVQASGPRTVLSPIGLNVRSQPSKTASVAGTAAQGAVLTVLSHTDQGGGWYQVKGSTLTGYITDNPALSAEGKFTAYSSAQHNFTALYPETWAATESPPASVVFHPKTGSDSIAVTTATTASQLAKSRPGYRQNSSTAVVVCGVTGNLVTFVQTASSPSTSTAPAGGAVGERYAAQVRLSLDAQHALGVDANLADLAQLPQVQNFLHSLAFPFPQCEGATASPQTSSSAPASTVP